MGGDKAPGEIIKGALVAVRDPQVEIYLVGDEKRVLSELGSDASHPRLHVVHSPCQVDMHEPASAALRRKDCSLRVAAQLVRSGRAQAFVRAGNSGATMAAALAELGTLAGVERPAIACH